MSDDLISRQAAIAYAISGRTRESEGEKWIRVSEVRESLQTMPPAEQEVFEILNEAHNEGYDVGYWAARRDYEPRWIPVSERLPEKRKYVLVRYKNNDMAVACWFDGDEDIQFWRAMVDEGWCADCDIDPTHWMPLPEPYEEEDNAKVGGL